MDYKKRRNRKCKISSEDTTLQKSILMMKTMNRDLALNMQRLKEELSKSSAQKASLKAELYDMMMERNSLMEQNMKLIELLKILHIDSLSMGQKIEEVLNPSDKGREKSTIKQNTPIFPPMVNGHVMNNPKIELKRLDFKDFPDTTKLRCLRSNDAINLSPIPEEKYEDMIPRRLGRRLQSLQQVKSISKKGFLEDSFHSDDTWSVEGTSENWGTHYSKMNNLGTSDPRVSSTDSTDMNLNPPVSDKTSNLTGNKDRFEAETESSENRPSVDGLRNNADSGKNSTSLLEINLISQKNDSQSTNSPFNPSIFVNVYPRKRNYVYGTKRSSNNSFTISGMADTLNNNHSNLTNSKDSVVLLEENPLSEETPSSSRLQANEIPGEKSISQSDDTVNGRKSIPSQSQPHFKRDHNNFDLKILEDFAQARLKRRSSRIRKSVNYKDY